MAQSIYDPTKNRYVRRYATPGELNIIRESRFSWGDKALAETVMERVYERAGWEITVTGENYEKYYREFVEDDLRSGGDNLFWLGWKDGLQEQKNEEAYDHEGRAIPFASPQTRLFRSVEKDEKTGEWEFSDEALEYYYATVPQKYWNEIDVDFNQVTNAVKGFDELSSKGKEDAIRAIGTINTTTQAVSGLFELRKEIKRRRDESITNNALYAWPYSVLTLQCGIVENIVGTVALTTMLPVWGDYFVRHPTEIPMSLVNGVIEGLGFMAAEFNDDPDLASASFAVSILGPKGVTALAKGAKAAKVAGAGTTMASKSKYMAASMFDAFYENGLKIFDDTWLLTQWGSRKSEAGSIISLAEYQSKKAEYVPLDMIWKQKETPSLWSAKGVMTRLENLKTWYRRSEGEADEKVAQMLKDQELEAASKVPLWSSRLANDYTKWYEREIVKRRKQWGETYLAAKGAAKTGYEYASIIHSAPTLYDKVHYTKELARTIGVYKMADFLNGRAAHTIFVEYDFDQNIIHAVAKKGDQGITKKQKTTYMKRWVDRNERYEQSTLFGFRQGTHKVDLGDGKYMEVVKLSDKLIEEEIRIDRRKLPSYTITHVSRKPPEKIGWIIARYPNIRTSSRLYNMLWSKWTPERAVRYSRWLAAVEMTGYGYENVLTGMDPEKLDRVVKALSFEADYDGTMYAVLFKGAPIPASSKESPVKLGWRPSSEGWSTDVLDWYDARYATHDEYFIGSDEDREENLFTAEICDVVNVVDGDTFDARYPNGLIKRIRIIGVDTPEKHYDTATLDTGEYDILNSTSYLAKWGLVATMVAHSFLDGKKVMIVPDETAGGVGFYGRTLATVYVRDSTGEWIDYAELMIRHGWARAYFEGESVRMDDYLKAQKSAMMKQTGMWFANTWNEIRYAAWMNGMTSKAEEEAMALFAEQFGSDLQVISMKTLT